MMNIHQDDSVLGYVSMSPNEAYCMLSVIFLCVVCEMFLGGTAMDDDGGQPSLPSLPTNRPSNQAGLILGGEIYA
jgi:hypothetical protein